MFGFAKFLLSSSLTLASQQKTTPKMAAPYLARPLAPLWKVESVLKNEKRNIENYG
jgi:hypothetical protein